MPRTEVTLTRLDNTFRGVVASTLHNCKNLKYFILQSLSLIVSLPAHDEILEDFVLFYKPHGELVGCVCIFYSHC